MNWWSRRGMADQDRAAYTGAVERVRQTHRDPSLRRVMAVLSVLMILGVAGTVLSVLNARATQQASQADVERNRDLVEQVRTLEAATNQDVREHRIRNEQLHADLCRIVYDVARQAGIVVRPCSPALAEGDQLEDLQTPRPHR